MKRLLFLFLLFGSLSALSFVDMQATGEGKEEIKKQEQPTRRRVTEASDVERLRQTQERLDREDAATMAYLQSDLNLGSSSSSSSGVNTANRSGPSLTKTQSHVSSNSSKSLVARVFGWVRSKCGVRPTCKKPKNQKTGSVAHESEVKDLKFGTSEEELKKEKKAVKELRCKVRKERCERVVSYSFFIVWLLGSLYMLQAVYVTLFQIPELPVLPQFYSHRNMCDLPVRIPSNTSTSSGLTERTFRRNHQLCIASRDILDCCSMRTNDELICGRLNVRTGKALEARAMIDLRDNELGSCNKHGVCNETCTLSEDGMSCSSSSIVEVPARPHGKLTQRLQLLGGRILESSRPELVIRPYDIQTDSELLFIENLCNIFGVQRPFLSFTRDIKCSAVNLSQRQIYLGVMDISSGTVSPSIGFAVAHELGHARLRRIFMTWFGRLYVTDYYLNSIRNIYDALRVNDEITADILGFLAYALLDPNNVQNILAEVHYIHNIHSENETLQEYLSSMSRRHYVGTESMIVDAMSFHPPYLYRKNVLAKVAARFVAMRRFLRENAHRLK